MIKTGRKTSKEKGEGEVKEKEKVQSGEPSDFWRPQAEKSRLLPCIVSFSFFFLLFRISARFFDSFPVILVLFDFQRSCIAPLVGLLMTDLPLIVYFPRLARPKTS